MKARTVYTFFFLFVLSFMTVEAQNVVFNAEIDTFRIFIGEQTKIKLELSVDAGIKVDMPQPGKELMKGIEVLDSRNTVSSLNDGKRDLYINEYTITSFDSTLYSIPPFEAVVNDSIFKSNPLALAVYSVPIDTANLQNIFGPKEIWDEPLTWEEYRDAVYLGIILAILSAVFVWVVVRFVKNKPIIRIVKIKPKLPSHVTALNRINEIKSDNSWRLENNIKDYYTRLTDVLREYMNDRYGFNATEMTTSEIIGNLTELKDKESLKELKEILEVADLVKFAKLHPSMNENDRNMINAIDFVNGTKNLEEEKVVQPTEKRIVNKRSVFEKRVLIVSIAAIAVLLLCIVTLFTIDLYNMFS